MRLWDPQLRFARDLIAQWIHIRRDGLVPFEEDLDTRTLIPLMSFITITAVAQPNAATFELVSPEVSRRWGRDMRHINLFDFITPERRATAEEAKRLFVSVPCGRLLPVCALCRGPESSRSGGTEPAITPPG